MPLVHRSPRSLAGRQATDTTGQVEVLGELPSKAHAHRAAPLHSGEIAAEAVWKFYQKDLL
jgi:hypothetical protein